MLIFLTQLLGVSEKVWIKVRRFRAKIGYQPTNARTDLG